MTVAADDFVSTRLSQLKVGAVLRQPIYDAQSQRRPLLLAAGCTLTESQLRTLHRRGVTSVLVHRSELERITGQVAPPKAVTQRLISSSPATPAVTVRNPATPPGFRDDADSFHRSVRRPTILRRDPGRAVEFARAYTHAVETVSTLVGTLVEHHEVNTRQVNDLSQQHLQQIGTDLDEFLMCGIRPVRTGYPSRHCLQTAMLACSVGTLMGLRRDELLELGFGCLLHDAGMLLVPSDILKTPGPISASQRLEMQKHPIHAANLLNDCRDVPHGARHVVYQMHERMNGSGYPRQRTGPQIHPLARIAAVADSYIAMISPRSYRSASEPYQAVEKVLFATRQGLFDSAAVRALIHTVSLFPIGSGVQLNDGRQGRVIRGNRDQFARPVIEIVDAEHPELAGEVIDLCAAPELTVVSTTELPANADAELLTSP